MKIGKLIRQNSRFKQKKGRIIPKSLQNMADINYKLANGEPNLEQNRVTLKMIKTLLIRKNMRILNRINEPIVHIRRKSGYVAGPAGYDLD